MNLHFFSKIRQSRREKGQSMVEFALVFPIFLLLVLGVIELGHLIFIYSSVYVSSREAVRYGVAAGYSSPGNPYYRDCTGMRAAAQRVGAYGGVKAQPLGINSLDPNQFDPVGTGVAIQLIRDGDTTNQAINFNDCSYVDPDPDKEITAGYRIRVTTQVQYKPIVPLVPFPSFAVSHTSTRTILKDVSLEKVDPGSPPVADTYGVDLSVADDSLLGLPGGQVIYDLSIKNTGSIFDTYTLTLSGNSWSTTLDAQVSVAPGATVVRQVVVTLPAAPAHGATDAVLITATSIGDPGLPPASDSLVLTTSAPTYGVDLATNKNAQGGQAGLPVTYDLTITNTGNVDDTYTLTASGNVWPASLPASIPVSAGATVSFQVIVTVPADYAGVASDTVTITAVSDGDPLSPPVSDTLALTTSAPFYGVHVWVPDNTLAGRPGSTTPVTYRVRVNNIGNVPDTYVITLSGSAWPTTTVATVDVPAGATVGVDVKVTIPATATHGSTDTVLFTVVSTNDPADPRASDNLSLTTTAFSYGVSLSATPGTYQMSAPGTVVTYNLTVRNTGTVDDTYTLTLSGNTWATTLAGSVTVAAGSSVTLPVVVTIPATAANGQTDRVTVRAISTGDPLTPPTSASISLTTAVPRYGVRLYLAVPDDSLSGAPGKTVTYYLGIQNTGNAPDTFTITLSGNGWSTSVEPTSITLGAGASNPNVVVAVTIAATALHNQMDVVTVTAFSGDAAAPRATASLSLTTMATRVCPYAGSLGLGNKSINLLLYNNNLLAESVTIEGITVGWYANTSTQFLDYISYLGRNIMNGDVPGNVLNPYMTSTFPAQGAWVGAATNRDLPAGASNYGFNVYFGENIDTTKAHSIEIRFSNGCTISR